LHRNQIRPRALLRRSDSVPARRYDGDLFRGFRLPDRSRQDFVRCAGRRRHLRRAGGSAGAPLSSVVSVRPDHRRLRADGAGNQRQSHGRALRGGQVSGHLAIAFGAPRGYRRLRRHAPFRPRTAALVDVRLGLRVRHRRLGHLVAILCQKHRRAVAAAPRQSGQAGFALVALRRAAPAPGRAPVAPGAGLLARLWRGDHLVRDRGADPGAVPRDRHRPLRAARPLSRSPHLFAGGRVRGRRFRARTVDRIRAAPATCRAGRGPVMPPADILFVSGNPYLPQIVGGVEVTTHEMLTELARRGYPAAVAARLSLRDGFGAVNATRAMVSGRGFTVDHGLGYPVFRSRRLHETAMALPRPALAVIQNGDMLGFAEAFARAGVATIAYFHALSFEDWDTARKHPLPFSAYLAVSEFTAQRFKALYGIEPTVVPPFFRRENYVTDVTGGAVTFINPVTVKGLDRAL